MSRSSAPRSPWVIGPVADRLLVTVAPLGCGAIVFALSSLFSSRTVWELVMTFGSVGHHLPGFLRTYGDRALFRRYWLRFTLAPPLFFGVALLAVFRDLHGLALFSLVWSLWHGMMQHYGFLRIYDAKAGIEPAHWSRLDFALTASWFALCITWGPSQVDGLLAGLIASTRWMPPAALVRGVAWVALAATAAITALYLRALASSPRAGRPVSSHKLTLLLSTTALVLFARVVTTDPFLSVALFELLHDVQYLAIVWALNRRLRDDGIDLGRVGRRLFGPGAFAAGAYVLFCLGYGGFGFADRQWLGGSLHQVVTAALVSSGLLHFYYDGFIWKVRERDVRRGLRLEEAAPPAAPLFTAPAMWRRFLHPLRYALPLAVLLGLEWGAPPRNALAEATYLTGLVPRSAMAQATLGMELIRRGQFADAIMPLRTAVALAPDHPDARSQLGVALLSTGDPAVALAQLRVAVRLEPDVPENWINLGDAAVATGDLRGGTDAYRRAVELGADSLKVWHNLGIALALIGRYAEAQDALVRAAAREPSSVTPHLALGQVLEKMGRLDEAAAAYDRALAIDPDFAPALQARSRLRAARAAR